MVEPPFVAQPVLGLANAPAVNAGAGTISAFEDVDALCATPAAMATTAVASTAATANRLVRFPLARFSLITKIPSTTGVLRQRCPLRTFGKTGPECALRMVVLIHHEFH